MTKAYPERCRELKQIGIGMPGVGLKFVQGRQEDGRSRASPALESVLGGGALKLSKSPRAWSQGCSFSRDDDGGFNEISQLLPALRD